MRRSCLKARPAHAFFRVGQRSLGRSVFSHFCAIVFKEPSVFAVAMMGIAANIIARYIERYKWIAWIGLLVILYVALKMIYDGWVDPQVGLGRLLT